MEDEDNMMAQNAMQEAAEYGRGGDTVIAHMTLGEVVIPKPMMDDPEVMQTIQALFEAYGEDMAEFTVGDQANKINPETGQPEFFSLGKIFKKLAPIVLPILGTMIAPGIGTALGSSLSGAALGGLGGYAGSGGLSGVLGKAPETIAWNQGGNSILNAGSGIRGALGGLGGETIKWNQGGLSSLASGGGGSSLSNLSNIARAGSSIYGMGQDDDALKKAERAMLESQGKASAALSPYGNMGLGAQKQLSENLASGFNPEDLTKDQGYQFRYKQGMDALNTSLANQGLGQSGGAMKALEDYRQNFAANEYSNAYDRWLSKNQQLAGVGGQGLKVAEAQGDIYGNMGDIRGASILQSRDAKNKRIAEILAGLGM